MKKLLTDFVIKFILRTREESICNICPVCGRQAPCFTSHAVN